MPLLTELMRRPWSRLLAWRFLQTHFDALIGRTPEVLRSRLVAATSSLCDPARRDEVQQFFGDPAHRLPGLGRRLPQALEAMGQCIELVEREQSPLSAWLQARAGKHATLERR